MTQAEQRAPTGRRKGRIVGRFEMYGKIASGGFAAIHLGRTVSAGGFSKTVAIKRLHQQFAEDRDVKRMFLDEARVVARVQHPNVVPTMDFVDQGGELFMVMEYVEGVTLGNLLHEMDERQQRIPLDIVLRIMVGALHGLHAAHEAKDERGQSMCIIHRDVSPDNILVGVDGHPRILDFGVARALGQYHATQEGHVKGKLNYMTPEQVSGEPLSCRTDVFAASIVLWQCMAGKPLFEGGHVAELAMKVTGQAIDPPSKHAPGLPRVLDEIVLRGLERDPAQRWQTADQMADELEQASTLATPGRVGKWIKLVAASRLAKRTEQVAAVERTPAPSVSAGSSGQDAEDGEDVDDVLDDAEFDETSTQASGGEKSYAATTTQVVKLSSSKPRHTTAEGTEVIDADELERQRAARHGGAPPAGPAPPSEGSGPPSVRIPREATAPSAAGVPGGLASQPRVVVQTGAVVPAGQATPSSPVLAASPSHPGLAAGAPSAPGPPSAPSTPGVHAGPSHPGLLAVPSAPAAPAPSTPAVAPPSQPSAAVPVPGGPELVDRAAAPSEDRSVELDFELDADEPLGRATARRRKVVWGLGGVVVFGLVVLAVGFVVSKPDHGSSEPAIEAAVEPAAVESSSEETEPAEPEATAEPEAATEPADDDAEGEDTEPEPSAEPSATPVAVAPRAPKATAAPPPTPPARPARPKPKPAAKSEEDLFARE